MLLRNVLYLMHDADSFVTIFFFCPFFDLGFWSRFHLLLFLWMLVCWQRHLVIEFGTCSLCAGCGGLGWGGGFVGGRVVVAGVRSYILG